MGVRELRGNQRARSRCWCALRESASQSGARYNYPANESSPLPSP